MRAHRLLKRRRDIAPGILQQRHQIIGRMPHQRILEIDQPLIAIGQQHDVFGMVIAQHRHPGLLPLQQRGQRFLPCRHETGLVHAEASGGAEPFGEQLRLAQIHLHVIGGKGAGRAAVQLRQRFHRAGIGGVFGSGIFIQPVAHPVRAEILDQHQPFIGAFGQDRGRAQAVGEQPAADVQERARVFMRGRRVHHQRPARAIGHAEIAAETGIAGQRFDPRSAPARLFQKFVQPRGQVLAHGQRPCQSAPASTIALRASPTISSVISRLPANPPACSGHSAISSAPSQYSSSPSSPASAGWLRR